ncbi:ribbon-helix-helix protein, CopG family [Sphingomonas sp. PL20]|uniref:ribbon-helix-helix protein, CopG family n=1 Tax=Sphingomonas sp. PL20 TaxID=2760712 RepID=UPI001AEB9965
MTKMGRDQLRRRAAGQVSAHLPPELIAALDRWRIQAGPVNRAEAIRRLLAKALDLGTLQHEPPVPPAPSRQEQDHRAEHLIELYRSLGSFEAVGRSVGLSGGRVATLIHRHENRIATGALGRVRDADA